MNLRLPYPFRSTNLPKSNSPGFGIGGALCGLACVVVATLDKASSAGWGRLLPLIGVCCLPFAIALAELRSGYAWKNLAPGNRGVHRTASRATFFCSVTFHLMLAAIIAGFGVWLSFNP